MPTIAPNCKHDKELKMPNSETKLETFSAVNRKNQHATCLLYLSLKRHPMHLCLLLLIKDMQKCTYAKNQYHPHSLLLSHLNTVKDDAAIRIRNIFHKKP